MNRLPEIVLVGMNHKTASVSVREQLSLTTEDVEKVLDLLKREPSLSEVLIFSTCNRVEVLFAAEVAADGVAAVCQCLSAYKGIPESEFADSLYIHEKDAAIRHLFRVAGSLDSLVLGEPQILGQVKQAYHCATTASASGVILNRLLHRAFHVAKRIRTETGIGDNAVSISYAAIELARKIFGELDGRKALLVGAGEMAELAVEHLMRHKVTDIRVANRTFERGVALARRFGGTAIRFDELQDALRDVDIVISSTGAPDYVIHKSDVKPLMKKRQNRSLFLIDIAVPRDIDPGINRLDNAYVYDIDDLKGVVDENLTERQREAVRAERIVDEAVIRFSEWQERLPVVPTIKALREKVEATLYHEAERTFHDLGVEDAAARAAISRMVEAMSTKILHDPIRLLKSGGMHGNSDRYLGFTRLLFRLDEENNSGK